MYKFSPILKTLVWGTESWVLSAVPGNESIILNGPKAGKSINDIFPEGFPLLIKFIDAHDDLSIQVHPNDELAMARHNSKGKTEMWYIIDAQPKAHLLSGLKEQIDAKKYIELVEKDEILSVLEDYSVKPGDVFFLPAGRIHAIGGGCYLAEIQQTSNITYRIYDYNRKGLDGKARELHTELAKDAIDYTVHSDYRTHYETKENEAVELVQCPYFTTHLLELDKAFTTELNSDFLVLIAMEGSVQLKTSVRQGEAGLAESEIIELKPGECALILSSEEKSVEIVPTSPKAKLLQTMA